MDIARLAFALQGGPFSDVKNNILKRVLQNQVQIDYDDENDY